MMSTVRCPLGFIVLVAGVPTALPLLLSFFSLKQSLTPKVLCFFLDGVPRRESPPPEKTRLTTIMRNDDDDDDDLRRDELIEERCVEKQEEYSCGAQMRCTLVQMSPMSKEFVETNTTACQVF